MNQLKAEMAELKSRNESKGLKGYLGRALNRTSVFAGVLIAGVVTSMVLYAAMSFTFSDGEIIYAEQINANFTELDNKVTELTNELAEKSRMIAPIGSIIAWHKNATSNTTLTIPEGWVECSGGNVVDSESPLLGIDIPDLNNDGRFLRGDTTSGNIQADAFQGHLRELHVEKNGSTGNAAGFTTTNNSGVALTGRNNISSNYQYKNSIANFLGGYLSDGTNGTPRIDDETRPVNMSVVWIMRIK